MSDRATTEYPPICIVSPSEFDPGTAQTSGSIRLAAIAPQLFVQSALGTSTPIVVNMLKSWLDENLPRVVEGMVEAEIERVTRGR
jgi:hypothetical protein